MTDKPVYMEFLIKTEQDMQCFFQEHYQSGDWIYPVAVVESINTSVDNVSEILEEFIFAYANGENWDIDDAIRKAHEAGCDSAIIDFKKRLSCLSEK